MLNVCIRRPSPTLRRRDPQAPRPGRQGGGLAAHHPPAPADPGRTPWCEKTWGESQAFRARASDLPLGICSRGAERDGRRTASPVRSRETTPWQGASRPRGVAGPANGVKRGWSPCVRDAENRHKSHLQLRGTSPGPLIPRPRGVYGRMVRRQQGYGVCVHDAENRLGFLCPGKLGAIILFCEGL